MIFLANNEIKALPLEFFKLSNLTVLSLRALSSSFLLFTLCTDSLRIGNNSLEYLPPEIAELYALKDLDVVNNNLRFLPAEMTTMTLTNLNVHTHGIRILQNPRHETCPKPWMALHACTFACHRYGKWFYATS
jgi:Leucine-rich repeat (LRR) protein